MTLQSRINPPGTELGHFNAVMGGRGRHVVEKFDGPLSIKFMLQGVGLWRTPERLFRVEEGHFLVLNARQTYALHFASEEPHESFCPFFRDGFVEDAKHVKTASVQSLLDDPSSAPATFEFPEHLYPDGRILPALRRLRALTQSPAADIDEFEDAFHALAAALVYCLDEDIARERARLPAVKASTRAECYRRLMRARDFIHAHTASPPDLDSIAKEAALSPHHFHRLFKATFGDPPHRYVVRLRLERAARLLARTDVSVTEVAARVGFESLGSFSTRFAREYGASPSAYRAGKTSRNEKRLPGSALGTRCAEPD